MSRHQSTSLCVAEWLEQQEGVTGVRHPLLTSHPQHALALSQHGGRHSGMVAFSLCCGTKAASFLSHLRLIKSCASLGSTHSLACQPVRLTHVMCTEEERELAGVGPGMVRLSIGLEETEDLLVDLAQALKAVV